MNSRRSAFWKPMDMALPLEPEWGPTSRAVATAPLTPALLARGRLHGPTICVAGPPGASQSMASAGLVLLEACTIFSMRVAGEGT